MRSKSYTSNHLSPLKSDKANYLLVLVSALLSISYPNIARAEVLAGPIVNPANGNSYYLLEEASWTASQEEAVKLGGNLVTINDEAEDKWVYQQFSKFGGRSRNLWIGLNDVETEGEMVWASGEPVSYTHWVPREPNDAGGGEDHVTIWGAQRGFAYGGYWNDLRNSGGKYRVYGVVEVVGEKQRSNDKAEDLYRFAGTYRTTHNHLVLKITKQGDLYSIDTGIWVGTGFWDRTNWQYEGVYRYKNNPSGSDVRHKPGGEAYNAVGYHRIKPMGNGRYSVHWTRALNHKRSQGSYVIERLANPLRDTTPSAKKSISGWNHNVLQLLTLQTRDKALQKLLQEARYPADARYTEKSAGKIKEVVVCPQRKGLPLVTVFARSRFDVEGVTPRNGHFIVIRSDGLILPFYRGANSLDGYFRDLNGDSVIDYIDSWGTRFEEGVVTGLHIVPVTEEFDPSLIIYWKKGSYSWRLNQPCRDRIAAIQIGNSNGNEFNSVAEYKWSSKTKRWIGPQGSTEAGFMRLDNNQRLDALKLLKSDLSRIIDKQ